MSSAIHLWFRPPVEREDWLQFCLDKQIRYSANTVGAHVFYLGDVQIVFGEANDGGVVVPAPVTEVLCHRSGPDWAGLLYPPLQASQITVSTYWLDAALPEVLKVADWLQERFRPIMVEWAPEFAKLRKVEN